MEVNGFDHPELRRPPAGETAGSVPGDLGSTSDDGRDRTVALPAPRPRPNGSILMAAMLGLANALGMEKTTEPSEMVQPADPRDDDLDLDFGSLPPLN